MLKLPYQITQVEDDSVPLVIQPGIISILADRDAQGRWKDGNLVRFAPSSGLASKVGGWINVTPTNLYNGQGFKGALRAAHEWQSLDRQFWAAVGTHSKLYLYNQGIQYDITPLRRTATLSNAFTTTNGSNVVMVTDALHGAFVGDNVQFTGFSTFNGVTISGEYTVLSITLNGYTIQAATSATASGTGGGTGTATYDINSMAIDAAPALGWSAGTWGTPRAPANITAQITGNTTLTVTAIANGVIGYNGTNVLSGSGVTPGTVITGFVSGTAGGIGVYTISSSANTASEAMQLTQGWGEPASSSNIITPLGIWSLDNWGEDLIASPRGGAIYIWNKSQGPFARATLISQNAPLFNNRVIVAQDARQIIAFGSSTGDVFGNPTGPVDPALIRWCNSEDYTTWIAAPTNTAGSLRLNAGSGIVAVTKTRGGYYMGSTTSSALLYASGDSNIYLDNQLGKASRPCGPQAAADFNGITYIMAQDNFQMFNGVLTTMPCDVWNHVFDQEYTSPTTGALTALNRAKMEKVTCHINRSFSEVWWNYPSLGGTGENDSYVVYNWQLNCWHYGIWSANQGGDINRSMGHDYGDVFQAPYMGYFNAASAVAPNLNGWSFLFTHETGYLANGFVGFGEYIASWDIDILNSGELVQVSHVLNNFKEFVSIGGDTPQVEVNLEVRKYPADTPKTKGPYFVTPTTQKLSARAKGRQISLQIGGDGGSGPANLRLLESSTAQRPQYRELESGTGLRILEAGSSTSQGVYWSMGAWRIKMGEDGDR
jgi:hypothetical protein